MSEIIKEKLYFSYGSNMNLNQMAFRCPNAEVVESVRLEGYRLAFRTNGGGNGVATILPEEGSYVDGVLWRISERDEQHLDHYEGFPFLYGKEPYLIILIRLFEKEFQNIYPESHYYERAIQFFENVCHIYKNKNKSNYFNVKVRERVCPVYHPP